MNSEQLKDFILSCLMDKKAQDVRFMKLDTIIADYMIFASGRSIKNISSIAEYVSLELKHKLNLSSHTEGFRQSDWILVDAGHVIVHLFHPDARQRIKLEELWADKKSN